MKFLKFTVGIVSAIILMSSCTEECCYDGNQTTLDDVLDVVASNEYADTIFSASFSGTLKNIVGKPIKNVSILLTDSLGREYKFITDENGKFIRTKLLSGQYNLRIVNLQIYEYSFEEYNTIIENITTIITGQRMASNAEKLAYHVVNFNDGLTTLDRFYFNRCRDGQEKLIDFQPWRLISRSDFDNNNLKIQDNIDIYLNKNENFPTDLLLIYIGDPSGYTL